MKERELWEQPLLPATQQLLEDVERTTGKRVDYRAEPAMKSRGRAMYVASEQRSDRHLILYDPDERRYLDHLLAHEASGHLRHFSEAAPEDRLLPVSTNAHLRAVVEELAPDLTRLANAGIRPRDLGEVVRLWVSGTVAQISDTPGDVEIEARIYREHSGLRAAQRASLDSQMALLGRVMEPQVRAITPAKVWLASNSMNYVLASAVSRFLGEPWMLRPYHGTEVERLGKELLAIHRSIEPETLSSFRAVSQAWAERLGVSGWFEWRRLDQLRGQQPIGFE